MKTIAIALSVLLCTPAFAMTDEDATNCIVGEASSCPFIVQEGIADAMINRSLVMKNPFHGVYGFHAKHNATESKATWASARKALASAKAEKRGLVKGAIYFGNGDDVKKGTFTGMTLTIALGDGKDKTYFFKP
jgi:hypothetical protein